MPKYIAKKTLLHSNPIEMDERPSLLPQAKSLALEHSILVSRAPFGVTADKFTTGFSYNSKSLSAVSQGSHLEMLNLRRQ